MINSNQQNKIEKSDQSITQTRELVRLDEDIVKFSQLDPDPISSMGPSANACGFRRDGELGKGLTNIEIITLYIYFEVFGYKVKYLRLRPSALIPVRLLRTAPILYLELLSKVPSIAICGSTSDYGLRKYFQL
jgi:hypothetical protein